MQKPILDPVARKAETVLIWLFVLQYILWIIAEIMIEALWGIRGVFAEIAEAFAPEPGAKPMGLTEIAILIIIFITILVGSEMIVFLPLLGGRKWAYNVSIGLPLLAIALSEGLFSPSGLTQHLIRIIIPIYLLRSSGIKRYFEYKRELRAFKKQFKSH